MAHAVVNLDGLLNTLVTEIGEYKVYKTLKHDKNTVKRWLVGGMPEDPCDIGSIIRLALHNHVDVSRYQTFLPIYDFSPEMSYEDNMFSGPPDLAWLWNADDHAPAHRTTMKGLEFDCPIGIASGPLTGNSKYTMTMLNLGYGPSTFKTRRAGPKGGWERPQIAFVLQPPNLLGSGAKPPEALVSFKVSDIKGSIPDIVNSVGGPSEAPAEWQKEYEEVRRHPKGRYVGVSVIGEDSQERGIKADFQDAIDRALEVSPPFIELNISCPNLTALCLRDPQVRRSTHVGRLSVLHRALAWDVVPRGDARQREWRI